MVVLGSIKAIIGVWMEAPRSVINSCFSLPLVMGSGIADSKGGAKGVGVLSLVETATLLDPFIASCSALDLSAKLVYMLPIYSGKKLLTRKALWSKGWPILLARWHSSPETMSQIISIASP